MRIESKRTYLLCLVIFLLSAGLLFSNNIWFDESYTCALIEHSYSDMISILKDDMHPPLYFVSLKFFTGCFGNSFVATKIFSLLGLFSALLLGCMPPLFKILYFLLLRFCWQHIIIRMVWLQLPALPVLSMFSFSAKEEKTGVVPYRGRRYHSGRISALAVYSYCADKKCRHQFLADFT